MQTQACRLCGPKLHSYTWWLWLARGWMKLQSPLHTCMPWATVGNNGLRDKPCLQQNTLFTVRPFIGLRPSLLNQRVERDAKCRSHLDPIIVVPSPSLFLQKKNQSNIPHTVKCNALLTILTASPIHRPLQRELHRVSYKTTLYLIAHNFGKRWPIFKIFSPSGLSRDRVMNWSLKVHHSLKASIPYLLKCWCQETTDNLKQMSRLTINFNLIYYS